MGLILDSSVLISAERQGKNARQMLTSIADKIVETEVGIRAAVRSTIPVQPMFINVIGQHRRCGEWDYAKSNGFTIVSKDSDFEERIILSGSPPKLIWIRARNCTTAEVESLLRAAFSSVKRFIQEDEETCLILGPRHGNK